MASKIDDAIILAAGRGIRMRPLTDNLPKAMAPFNGSTLIYEGIKQIRDKIKNVYITVGHKKSILASHVIEKNVSAVINTNKKGNAWWIYNSLLKYIDKPLLVLTCDNLIKLDFNSLIEEYINMGSPHCMIVPTKPIKGISGDYIFKTKKNLITKLSRKSKSNLYCSGIQILNIKLILRDTNKCNDFKILWKQLINKKLLYCSNTLPFSWYSIDNIKQLKNIKKKQLK